MLVEAMPSRSQQFVCSSWNLKSLDFPHIGMQAHYLQMAIGGTIATFLQRRNEIY